MFTLKSIVLLVAVIIAVSVKPSRQFGGPYDIDDERRETALQKLKTTFAQLADEYTIVKVTRVRDHPLGVFVYDTVLKNDEVEKNCEVDIWYGSGYAGEVEIRCENEDKVEKYLGPENAQPRN